MPWSDYHLRPQILARLREYFENTEPFYFTDVGCGGGANLEFYKPYFPDTLWTGIEIHAPYVDRFELAHRYDRVVIGDARELPIPEADVTFLGDVLEHMELEEAQAVYQKAYARSRVVVVQVPLGEYQQGALNGNEHETHRHTWTQRTLEDLPGLIKFTYTGPNQMSGREGRLYKPGPVIRGSITGAIVVGH